MSKVRREMQDLSELIVLQGLRCLVAEQAEGDAFRHLTKQISNCDEATEAVAESISDWDDFWMGAPGDPRWLNGLARCIMERENILSSREEEVFSARLKLKRAIEKHTQQRDCKTDLSKRLRRKSRLWNMMREEAVRASIPNKLEKTS